MLKHIIKASRFVNTARGTAYALSYFASKAKEFNHQHQVKVQEQKPQTEIRSAIVITVPHKDGYHMVVYDTQNDSFLMSKPFASEATHQVVTDVPLDKVFKGVLEEKLLPRDIYMRIPAFRKLYKAIQKRLDIKIQDNQVVYTLNTQGVK